MGAELLNSKLPYLPYLPMSSWQLIQPSWKPARCDSQTRTRIMKTAPNLASSGTVLCLAPWGKQFAIHSQGGAGTGAVHRLHR